MGADGGTIPRRDELVRTKKKPEKIEKDVENAAKWGLCAMSQQPLREPIVACRLGRLYNKECVIEGLLNKTMDSNENGRHIRSIKEVKVLNLTPNPAFIAEAADKGDGAYKDHNVSPYICPVVGLELSGKYRFVFSWGCGCVVSEKALREIKSDNCHKCGKKWEGEEEVVLNGTEEEMEGYRVAMEERRQLEALAKKARKASKTLPDNSASQSWSEFKVPSVPGTSAPSGPPPKPALKRKSEGPVETGKIDRKEAKLKKKSLQSDPNASSVYKSLFTSSSDGKKQPRAHWVTFNPQYF